MPIRPFEQKATFRTDEQAAATPTAAEAKAYRALDPADPATAWTGPVSTFERGVFTAEPGGINSRVAQVTQVRTDEQAGTAGTAAKRAYTNL